MYVYVYVYEYNTTCYNIIYYNWKSLFGGIANGGIEIQLKAVPTPLGCKFGLEKQKSANMFLRTGLVAQS